MAMNSKILKNGEINLHFNRIRQLCKKNKVRTLFAFGSFIQGNYTSESDIDLLVDIDESDPLSYADYYFDLKFKLELIFNRPVDLLELRTLKNPYLKDEIDKTKVLLYGNEDKNLVS